ncbi:MAG: hypothetical protein AB7J28_16290 [Hyphomonadaceae bacterium]
MRAPTQIIVILSILLLAVASSPGTGNAQTPNRELIERTTDQLRDSFIDAETVFQMPGLGSHIALYGPVRAYQPWLSTQAALPLCWMQVLTVHGSGPSATFFAHTVFRLVRPNDGVAPTMAEVEQLCAGQSPRANWAYSTAPLAAVSDPLWRVSGLLTAIRSNAAEYAGLDLVRWRRSQPAEALATLNRHSEDDIERVAIAACDSGRGEAVCQRLTLVLGSCHRGMLVTVEANLARGLDARAEPMIETATVQAQLCTV